jgi:Mn-dependent DtxR family transcriptional regulator
MSFRKKDKNKFMAENNITKELDILQIIKEDIIEALGRKNKKIPSLSIEPEIKTSHFLISKALGELEKEGLIKTERELVFLTKQGKKKAEDFIEKHSIIENYFKRTKSEKMAWKAASILEHYISMEVIDNIKKLSTFKEEGIPLTESKQEKGLIIDVVFGIELFERIISMGICPGKRIKITNKLPNSIIVEIENKKFALDKNIAKGIKILDFKA